MDATKGNIYSILNGNKQFLIPVYQRYYAIKLLQLNKREPEPFSSKERRDALRFADLLSKSNDPEKVSAHKIWAQEIVILLNELYPEDSLIKLYAGDVFSSIGNHKGVEHINADYQDITALERFFSEFSDDYLTIPAEPGEKFFAAQKTAYDHLTEHLILLNRRLPVVHITMFILEPMVTTYSSLFPTASGSRWVSTPITWIPITV